MTSSQKRGDNLVAIACLPDPLGKLRPQVFRTACGAAFKWMDDADLGRGHPAEHQRGLEFVEKQLDCKGLMVAKSGVTGHGRWALGGRSR